MSASAAALVGQRRQGSRLASVRVVQRRIGVEEMPNLSLDRERVEFLAARQRIGEEQVPAWPRRANSLPLVEVEVPWVRFSTLNHRTRAEQRREIARMQRLELFTAD